MTAADPQLRIAGFADDSVVDGTGLRFTLFLQGCPYRCEGCHNPETHDPAGGRTVRTSQVLARLRANPLLSGLTLSGGEPLMQAQALIPLCEAVRADGLNIWLYTGSTFEGLLSESSSAELRMLSLCDVLVDGPFLLKQRTLARPFVGSTNQRVLDARRSLAAGCAVLLREAEETQARTPRQ